jgi:outer membrane murein-binding lipoprotein Lpp
MGKFFSDFRAQNDLSFNKLRSMVTQLQMNVDIHKSHINRLEADVDALKSQVFVFDKDFITVWTQLSTLESTVNILRGEVAAANSNIRRCEAAMIERHNNLFIGDWHVKMTSEDNHLEIFHDGEKKYSLQCDGHFWTCYKDG